MRTISFEVMYRILEDCSAVIWDDNFLSYKSMQNDDDAMEEGEPFLTLECTEDESLELVSVQFRKKDNLEVKVEGASLWLMATDDIECQITPLFSRVLSGV